MQKFLDKWKTKTDTKANQVKEPETEPRDFLCHVYLRGLQNMPKGGCRQKSGISERTGIGVKGHWESSGDGKSALSFNWNSSYNHIH